MLLTVTSGFLLLLINGIYGLTATIFATKQGILGPGDLQLKCVYSPGSGDTVLAVSIEAEISNTNVTIVTFYPANLAKTAKYSDAGKDLLSGRATLTNPLSTPINGQFEAVITYNETTCEDERRYRCKVTNNAGGIIVFIYSQLASIVVKGRPLKPDSPPTWKPSSSLEEGMIVNFTCTGNVGKPAGKFVWTKYRGNTPYPQGDVTTIAQHIPGTCTSNGTSVLSVQVQAEDNNAVFRCQVEQELADNSMYQQTQPYNFNVYYFTTTPATTTTPNPGSTVETTLTFEKETNCQVQNANCSSAAKSILIAIVVVLLVLQIGECAAFLLLHSKGNLILKLRKEKVYEDAKQETHERHVYSTMNSERIEPQYVEM